MIISSNRSHFTNLTTANIGRLSTPGYIDMGRNEAFFAFKPATVCKKSGFLTISASGYINTLIDGMILNLLIEISKPGANTDYSPLIYEWTSTHGIHYFSAHVDIPVGNNGLEGGEIAITSHIDNISTVNNRYSYITAEPDEVFVGYLKYDVTDNLTPLVENTITVTSITATYKEN
jgi:hypothetical protein